jgi:hypothetical protein
LIAQPVTGPPPGCAKQSSATRASSERAIRRYRNREFDSESTGDDRSCCDADFERGALAQGASDFAPGTNQDELILFYSTPAPFGELTGSPTPGGVVDNLGQAIAGGFYGNTSNSGTDVDAPDRGHGVTPSISPGPQTVGGDGPGTGTSIGDFIQLCVDGSPVCP